MSPISQRCASKERFWLAMMRQWRSSGLSVRAFCRKQGFSQPSFYAWRRRLAEREAAAVRFVPVQVTPEPKSPTTVEAAPGAMELVLGAGRRLRVGPGFDGPTLTRLLALLEEGQP